jgi:uncharacterized protein (DUF2267 family)
MSILEVFTQKICRRQEDEFMSRIHRWGQLQISVQCLKVRIAVIKIAHNTFHFLKSHSSIIVHGLQKA